MNKSLKVAAIPLDIIHGDVSANLDALRRQMMLIPDKLDLVVLPELFSTGFVDNMKDVSRLAESNSGTAMRTLHSLAEQYNVAFAGSFLAVTGGLYYNRGFFVEPLGDETFYDKRHLFSNGGEHTLINAGTQPVPVIRYRGWNIAMQICYDLRFPVWSRNVENKYDLMLVPANWPVERAYAWTHLLIARAIENQSYVIGANRSGAVGRTSYDDNTYIFGPDGKPVGSRLGRSTLAYVAELSLDEVASVRRHINTDICADRFTLDI